MKTLPVQKKSQEVAVLEKEEENQLPDCMRADAGQTFGMEAIETTDCAIPRLKIMQGLSPEKEQFSFLKSGDFFHTANEIVLEQPILATVILVDKRYILWRPRDMGGGILARANDARHWIPANQTFHVKLDKKDGGANVTWTTTSTVISSGLAEWGSMNPEDPQSAPAATLMYNLLLAFPAQPELSPAILTLQRTGVKAAQALNMKFKTLARPTFQSVIRFTSFLDHSGANDFYSVKTELAGTLLTTKKWYATDEHAWPLGTPELYANYKTLYTQLSQSGLHIKDEESLQGDLTENLSVETQGF